MKRLRNYLRTLFNAVMLTVFMVSAVGFVAVFAIFAIGEPLRKHLEEPNECQSSVLCDNDANIVSNRESFGLKENK